MLGQRWTLVGLLAVGSSAAVFEARHRNGKRVALKVLRPEHARDEGRRRRFLREGYAANRVNHPRAVSVDDDHVEPDGTAFLVMELLEGEPLDRLVRREGGRLPWQRVVELCLDLLEVLEAAHAQGVVHRDLKPANLFLQVGKGLRVLDFGLARREGDPHPTHEGALLGTPAFMAPEQARGATKAVGPWTDLWAVGALAFSLLTGRKVHEGRTLDEQIALAGVAGAPDLSALARDVPVEVSAVFQRALAYEPEDRFPNARGFHDALAAARAASRAERTPSPQAAKAEPGTLDRTVEDLPEASTRSVSRGHSPRRPFVPWLLVGGAGLAAFLAFRAYRASASASASATTSAAAAGAGPSAPQGPAAASHSPRAPLTVSTPANGLALPSTRVTSAPSPPRPRAVPSVSARPSPPPSALGPVRAGGSKLIEEPPF